MVPHKLVERLLLFERFLELVIASFSVTPKKTLGDVYFVSKNRGL